jgi:hypothetical protein
MTGTRFPTIFLKEVKEMKFLKFLFTARMSFVLFALLAFAVTMLYLAWGQHSHSRIVIQQPRAVQAR